MMNKMSEYLLENKNQLLCEKFGEKLHKLLPKKDLSKIGKSIAAKLSSSVEKIKFKEFEPSENDIPVRISKTRYGEYISINDKWTACDEDDLNIIVFENKQWAVVFRGQIIFSPFFNLANDNNHEAWIKTLDFFRKDSLKTNPIILMASASLLDVHDANISDVRANRFNRKEIGKDNGMSPKFRVNSYDINQNAHARTQAKVLDLKHRKNSFVLKKLQKAVGEAFSVDDFYMWEGKSNESGSRRLKPIIKISGDTGIFELNFGIIDFKYDDDQIKANLKLKKPSRLESALNSTTESLRVSEEIKAFMKLLRTIRDLDPDDIPAFDYEKEKIFLV